MNHLILSGIVGNKMPIQSMACPKCGKAASEYSPNKWQCLHCQTKFIYEPFPSELHVWESFKVLDSNGQKKDEICHIFGHETNEKPEPEPEIGPDISNKVAVIFGIFVILGIPAIFAIPASCDKHNSINKSENSLNNKIKDSDSIQKQFQDTEIQLDKQRKIFLPIEKRVVPPIENKVVPPPIDIPGPLEALIRTKNVEEKAKTQKNIENLQKNIIE